MKPRKEFAALTTHPIDRTALIAGLMFSFSGIAYLVNDHDLVNVSEGAATGGIVIIIGIAILLSLLFDPAETQLVNNTATVGEPVDSTTLFGAAGTATGAATAGAAPDFSWANPRTEVEDTADIAGFDAATSDNDAASDSLAADEAE